MIDPAVASISTVPVPPLDTSVPAERVTLRPAISDRCPVPDVTLAWIKISEELPPACNNTFPLPCAATETPSPAPIPSVSVKLPFTARITTEPFPPVVRTSESAASVTVETDPSAATRSTVTLTVPTTSESVSNKLIPPLPARAETVPPLIPTGFTTAPKVPIPTPATNRIPSPANATRPSPLPKMEPETAVTETSPPVETTSLSRTLSAAYSRIDPAPSTRLPTLIEIEPVAASTEIVPPVPVATDEAAKIADRRAKSVT